METMNQVAMGLAITCIVCIIGVMLWAITERSRREKRRSEWKDSAK